MNSIYFMRKITRVWLHTTSLFSLITAHTKAIQRIRTLFEATEYLIHIIETFNEDEPTSGVRKLRSSDDNNKQGRAEKLGGRADSGLMHYFGACQYYVTKANVLLDKDGPSLSEYQEENDDLQLRDKWQRSGIIMTQHSSGGLSFLDT